METETAIPSRIANDLSASAKSISSRYRPDTQVDVLAMWSLDGSVIQVTIKTASPAGEAVKDA